MDAIKLAAPNYKIPGYLRDHLRLDPPGAAPFGPLRGPHGDIPPARLGASRIAILRMNVTPLTACVLQADNTFGWRGAVGVGGRVESITVAEFGEVPLAVVSVVGVALRPDATPYRATDQRGDTDAPPTFEDGLLDEEESYYTFLAPEGGGLAALAETAMLGKGDAWFRGRVSFDAEGWHNTFALPLVLEQVTLFAGI